MGGFGSRATARLQPAMLASMNSSAKFMNHQGRELGRGGMVNSARLPHDSKSACIGIFWNDVKVHMRHFLMRERAIILQHVVRGCASCF